MKTPNKTPKPYESIEDFKMRLRVLMGRPAIVGARRASPSELRPTGKPTPETTV